MTRWSAWLLRGMIVIAAPMTVAAQRSVHVGVALTSATPVGKFSDSYATGFGGLAMLAYGNDNFPLGLRLDVANTQARGRTVDGVKSSPINLTSVSANLIGTVSLQSLKPYAIGGGGWYPYRGSSSDKRENHFGINGGAGVTFPFPVVGAAFLESRYHRIFGRTETKRYVSVSLGVAL